MTHPVYLQPNEHGYLLQVKAIPNAIRDQIVGVLGVRLKIKISAPGKANRATIQLIAQTLNISVRQIILIQGSTTQLKCFQLPANIDYTHLPSV